MEKRKIRGTHRKLRRVKALGNQLHYDSKNLQTGLKYIDFLLPIHQALVEGKNAKSSVKKLCVEQLLAKCLNLMRMETGNPNSTVIAFIATHTISTSRVIMFFDKTYFRNFFVRSGPQQTWELLQDSRSLIREWNLSGFEQLQSSEIGFREKIDDDEIQLVQEIWCYGDTSDVKSQLRRLTSIRLMD